MPDIMPKYVIDNNQYSVQFIRKLGGGGIYPPGGKVGIGGTTN